MGGPQATWSFITAILILSWDSCQARFAHAHVTRNPDFLARTTCLNRQTGNYAYQEAGHVAEQPTDSCLKELALYGFQARVRSTERNKSIGFGTYQDRYYCTMPPQSRRGHDTVFHSQAVPDGNGDCGRTPETTTTSSRHFFSASIATRSSALAGHIPSTGLVYSTFDLVRLAERLAADADPSLSGGSLG